jgi:DNA polymerase-3 subunit epsilon
MLIAGFDVETTGLNPRLDEICEIGAALWDTERKVPVKMISEITLLPHGMKMPPELTKIHGITQEDIGNYGEDLSFTLKRTLSLFQNAEAVFAHNAPFDRSFFEAKIASSMITNDSINQITWVDSMRDLPCSGGKLGHVAAEHGFINPFPHRALFDVLTMLKIVSHYDVERIIGRVKGPRVKLVALVSFGEKDFAKEAGFFFDAPSKTWQKIVPRDEAEELAKTFPFKVKMFPVKQ